MSLRFGGGGGAPVADATTTTPGLVEVDVVPTGAHPVALTQSGYPGVTPNGTGGFLVSVSGGNIGVSVSSTTGNAQLRPDSLTITRQNDSREPFLVLLAAGSSGTELQMIDSNSVSMWEVDADGTELLAGSIGVNGQTAPGFPVLATGAGHTVDQVIALLQLIGFCKQS